MFVWEISYIDKWNSQVQALQLQQDFNYTTVSAFQSYLQVSD